MGILRKLFPKKKDSKDEAITEIRAAINQFTLRSRNYYNKSIDSREAAKRYLRQGNPEASKLQLKRWSKYNTQFNRYQKQVGSLEDAIEMIQSAEDAVTMNRALTIANSLLDQSNKILMSEKAMETMMKTQQLTEEIEMKSDLLSQQLDMDQYDEGLVDREFEKLQSEVAIEEAGILPEAPTAEGVAEELKKVLAENDLKEKE